MQAVFGQLKLTPQKQVDINAPVFDSIKSPAVILIVVCLGDRRAPVDHQRFMQVFGNTCTADIVFLGILVGVELKLHFGKIGRFQKALDPSQLFRSRVAVDIVLVNGVVHNLEFNIGLHGIRISVKIQSQIFTDVQLLCCGFLRDRADPVFQAGFHCLQLMMHL